MGTGGYSTSIAEHNIARGRHDMHIKTANVTPPVNSTLDLMSYSLRSATENDQAFKFEAFKVTMREYVEWAWGWDEEFQSQGFWNNLSVEKFKVVCLDQQPVGALYIEENDQHHWVRTIFLKPEYQGMGIGSSLLQNAASRAKDAGKPLVLKVIKINPAKQLYERLGFQVVKEDDVTYLIQMI